MASLAGCAGDITPITPAPGQMMSYDSSSPLPVPDAGPAFDTTSQPQPDSVAPVPDTVAPVPGPGEPCPAADCTADAICLGGLCHRKCATQAQCNEKVAGTGCAKDEICLSATSFTDACFPAAARLGELCGPDAEGALCQAGMLCVTAGEAKARCMSLCKDGCAAGQQCAATDNGCEVCL